LIEVELEPDRVRITLRDSGHGLGEGRTGQATDPFYTTKMVGTGMGLTLVKRIVEDHGGSLRV
jgi:nitrogen fixation/metabolism regulation signal transduction histidine kinase